MFAKRAFYLYPFSGSFAIAYVYYFRFTRSYKKLRYHAIIRSPAKADNASPNAKNGPKAK